MTGSGKGIRITSQTQPGHWGEKMKEPKECKNIDDIRENIDFIDKQIISLLSKRSEYVHNAAKFKTSVSTVKADDRVKAMLLKRREWAKENNLNEDFIESLYTNIVEFFINQEMNKWKEKE